MRTEDNHRYNRKQQERKALVKKQIIMRKRRRKLLIYIGIFAVFCMSIFSMGKKAGRKAAQKEYQEVMGKQVFHTEEDRKTEDSENTDTLILVNKNHKLPEDYEVELMTMYDKVNRAAKEAYGPLNDMLAAGRAEGLAFEICSSYRDVKVQERLFQEDVDALMQQGYTYEEAYAEVERETMPPGHSEHSTGLAFDIVSLGYQLLDAGQENTPETQWLHENCAKYGFILRYPKGKEEITDIDYESWHYRYVGVEVATYIMEQGITLEEYLELL